MQSAREVWESLQDSTYQPVLVHLSTLGWRTEPENQSLDLSDFSAVISGEKRRFDAAFVAIHGRPGENGELAAYLEMLGVPHTSCDMRAGVLTFDKALCKICVEGTGVRLAKAVLLRRSDALDRASLQQLKLPIFVKPNRNGSSCGISKVKNSNQLDAAIEQAFRYDDELLAEEGVEGGRELTCAVYTHKGEVLTLPICEVRSGQGHEFFDYEAKYTAGQAEEIVPAPIPEALAELVRKCSIAIYRKLGLRGLVRIDYIEREGELWFLEVNTVPGMSRASIVPRMLRAAGLKAGDFFASLLDEALQAASSPEKVHASN